MNYPLINRFDWCWSEAKSDSGDQESATSTDGRGNLPASFNSGHLSLPTRHSSPDYPHRPRSSTPRLTHSLSVINSRLFSPVKVESETFLTNSEIISCDYKSYFLHMYTSIYGILK